MTLLPAVPFHRPPIGEAEIQAVAEVLRSGWITTGPKTAEFEAAFAAYVGARHAVAVSSGTAALHLSLLAAGLRPGEAILTSPLTFPATTEAAIYCGARPVFADVDPVTANLDPNRAETVLARESRQQPIRAIVPVHYGGQPCAMEAFVELARRYDAVLVEDAAHALPAWRCMPGATPFGASARHLPEPPAGSGWRMVGTIGDFTAFSFYATKPLTTGEGGMITCESAEMAELLRSLRLHGLSGDAWKRYSASGSWRYDVARTGYKYNLPDVLAAIGLEQLRRADALAAERRRLAALYLRELARLEEHLELPGIDPRSGHAWHLFPVRLREPQRRDSVIEALKARGIGTSVHFVPVHLHSFYARTYGYRRGDFPLAERVGDASISLPLYPGLGDEGVGRVVEALEEVLSTSATR
jgi:perosamine synthetase